mmetsp:Transcript_63446/g.186114  ORF Transcript_63446/g.186114 Transcript_63446/m.186114 type:complete len:220 (-) Transcript_63446:264-923(-)
MRLVWKPPEAFRNLACMAPAASACSFSAAMAGAVPAQEKPLGKRMLAIWHTSPPTASESQSSSSLSCSRPATDTMDCGLIRAASCIASPRTLTSSMPCSKVKTPAAQRAVYSPRERPATAPGRSTASGLDCLSFARPAIPARNIAGWQTLVSSSFSSGPFRQYSMMSKPSTALAVAMSSRTSSSCCRACIILTYWEPCPGKSSAMDVRGFFFLSSSPGT